MLRHWMLISLFFAGSANAQDDELESLASELIALRGEVEALHDAIEVKQQDHRNRVSGLAQRKAELDALIQRQELEVEKLEKSLAEMRTETDVVNEEVSRLAPAVRGAIDTILAQVNQGLPYQTVERRQELQTIATKLDAGEITAGKALQQVWTFIEDELRLSRENALYRQTIAIDGEEYLADAIHIGMVMLFFRTGDGRHGFAERTESGWVYRVAEGSDASLISTLFEDFERSVRTGFFELPNTLPGSTQ